MSTKSSCITHPELFPTTCTPEQFTQFWNANKDALLKIHTRKLNRKYHIVDTNGREYQLAVRKGEAHLIPRLNQPPSNRELEKELDELKKLDKEFQFIDNRLRAVEASFQRILEKLELPATSVDQAIIAESLYTQEQKDAKDRADRRATQKSEHQKLKILDKINAELEAAGIVPLDTHGQLTYIKN